MLLKGKKIFIVEDNPANLAVMSSILRRAGAEVHFDVWGMDTVNRLKKSGTVDLILLDLMLPCGKSGYDVYETLQTVPELAEIPVIIVSAADPESEMKKARDMGFRGFICKPINHKWFPHQIANAIEGQAVWDDQTDVEFV